jgi:hypothetical protein
LDEDKMYAGYHPEPGNDSRILTRDIVSNLLYLSTSPEHQREERQAACIQFSVPIRSPSAAPACNCSSASSRLPHNSRQYLCGDGTQPHPGDDEGSVAQHSVPLKLWSTHDICHVQIRIDFTSHQSRTSLYSDAVVLHSFFHSSTESDKPKEEAS